MLNVSPWFGCVDVSFDDIITELCKFYRRGFMKRDALPGAVMGETMQHAHGGHNAVSTAAPTAARKKEMPTSASNLNYMINKEYFYILLDFLCSQRYIS